MSENIQRRRRSDRHQTQAKKGIGFWSILLLFEIVLVFILFNFIGWGLTLILSALAIIYFLLNVRSRKKGRKRPKGTVLIVILYLIINVIGIRTFGVLGSLVSTSETNQFYVLALTDDSADSVDEIESGSVIALGAETDYATNVFPQAKFKELGYDFRYTAYSSEVDSVGALLAGNTNYAVVSDPKGEQLLEAYPELSNQTKVIGKFKDKTKIKTSKKNVKRDVFTVLLTGVDTRTNSIDSNSRSDSIMVAKIDPKNAKAQLISLPRDTYVSSTCTGGYDKLTHSSVNGMNCLIDDVEGLLDTQIDYYLKVNFFTVIDAIDAVGGIDIEVDTSFCGQDEYDNANAYCFTPGLTHMDGSMALSYARERHAFSNGDYARAEHQQQVINGFTNSLISSGPLVINNLLAIASSSARTNLSSSQLTDLAKLLISTGEFEMDTYTVSGYGQTVDIPYWGLYGTSVQVLDEASLQEAKSLLADF